MLRRSKISATQFIVASVFLMALTASTFLLRSSVAQSAERGRPVNPYEFSEAVIRSLALATDAQRVLQIPPLSDNVDEAVVGMTTLRIAVKKLEQANAVIQRFSKSDDGTIAASVLAFDIGYRQLIDALNGAIRVEEKMLTVSSKQEQAALLSETSKWLAEAYEAWRLLPNATALASHALADNKRLVDGKLPYLRITAAEKAQLLEELEQYFGESVKITETHEPNSLSAPVTAAALLWGMLNQPWKPSDAE